MFEPTAAASYARTFIDFAVTKGADRGTLLTRAAIRPSDLEDPDTRIPFARFKRLMRVAKELCNEPALGLLFGESGQLYKNSIVGLIIHSSETMGEAFAQFSRLARLVIDMHGPEFGERFAITRDNGQVWLEDRWDPGDFPELPESTFARLVCDSARLFPGRSFVNAVHFAHAAPPYRAEYDRILKAPIVFESGKNALVIDAAWLTTKMPPANPLAFGIFSVHAEAVLKELEDSQTMRGRVENLLIPILNTGDVTMESIAAKLGISRPTLFRRLKAEGVNFETVLDELRHKTALLYLREKSVSVNETAYLVGFSDSTTFSRAFKRWTGTPPRALRSSKIDNSDK